MDANYETFLSEAPIWVAAMDTDCICRSLSAAWRAGLGVDSNSELALPLAELLASGESATTNAVADAIKTQSTIHAMPTKLAVPSGSVDGYLSAWPAATGDDARTIIFVSFTDQHLEAELAQLRRHQDLIIEAAGEGIYGLDNQGCTTFVNQAATQILGWRAEDVLGQPLHGIHHHSFPDGSPYPRDECPIYAAFKDGKVHREDTEVFWHSDGTAIPVEYTSTPIRENGDLIGAVVVFRDISERRALEQQREQDFHEISRLKEQLEQERDYLRDEIRVTSHYRGIIGDSQALQRTLAQIEAVAATPVTVLIQGESGVGKEGIARAIHDRSDRADQPMVKVNCASIPSELFESEFFGHVQGAFTGAHRDRVGRLQLADGGTLFLDEIGEIPLPLQGKLLRALQEHEFERVGDDRTVQVDVRVIAATNRDLSIEISEGRFREDLFYRLSVFPIDVPSLRDRLDDIGPLAQHFLENICEELGRDPITITKQQIATLRQHDWPGNVRELKNVVERAVILTSGARLRLDLAFNSETPLAVSEEGEFVTDAEFREMEKANLNSALRHANWQLSGTEGAAALLGLKPSTLAYRMKTFDITKPAS